MIIENGTGSAVVMGSRVTIREVGEDETEVYQIVGSQEANPLEGRISDESPLGRALMGHLEGDTVQMDAPVGTISYSIISIIN